MRLSRDPAARRRLAALAGAAALATVIGAAVGSRPNGHEEPSAPAARDRDMRATDALGLEQQVGQLLILSFDGPSLPSYVRRALRDGKVAGAVLFADNVLGPEQLRELTGELRSASRGGALVAADQEGGSIRILPFAAPAAGQSSLATVAAATEAAAAAGRDLADAGVNVNLAPVADVPAGPRSALAGRAYPGDSEEVAALVAAAVGSYEDAGVAATAKHFPGLGRASANTDDASVTIAASRSELESDLEPFRAAAAERVPVVMASHALYPAYDRERIASQSPAVLGDLLREQLEFEGAIVTDSLEAQAVLDRSTVEVAAERSVAAGADLVLMTGSGSLPPVYERLLSRARSSPQFRARVRQSAARVLSLKRRLGLPPPD